MDNSPEKLVLWLKDQQRKLDEVKEMLSKSSPINHDQNSSDVETMGRESEKELTFLIIEDNLDDEFLMLRVLTKLKFYNVTVARHGQEALHYLFGGKMCHSSAQVLEKPDLIFLDLRMPVMDGVEFLEIASDSLRNSGIPVVITTSCAQDKNVSKCRQLGAKAYLRKPIYAAELEKVIKSSVGSYAH